MFSSFESTWLTIFLIIVGVASVVSWWLDHRQERARRAAMRRHPSSQGIHHV